MNAAIAKVRVIKREPEFVGTAQAAPESLVRRIEMMIANAGADPSLGTPLAIMRIRGQIPRHHFEAVERLRQQRARYLRAIGAKGIRSSTGERVGSSQPPDPDSDAGQKEATKDKRAIDDFERALRAAQDCGRGDFELFRVYALEWADGSPGQAAGAVTAAIRRVAEAVHQHYSLRRRRSQREKRG